MWQLDRATTYRPQEAAADHARRRLQADPADATALTMLADWYAYRGQWNWAAELRERGRDAGATISPLALAREHWRLDDPERAAIAMQEAAVRGEANGDYLSLCRDAIVRPIAEPPAFVGSRGGNAFQYPLPSGATLVGCSVNVAIYHETPTSPMLRIVKSLRPIYRTAQGDQVSGELLGSSGGFQQRTLVARPGYAIGRVIANGGRRLVGFRLVYMRIMEDGRLDPSDRYESSWVGGHTPYPDMVIAGDGRKITGLRGWAGTDIDGMTLLVEPYPAAPAPATTRSTPPPATLAP